MTGEEDTENQVVDGDVEDDGHDIERLSELFPLLLVCQGVLDDDDSAQFHEG